MEIDLAPLSMEELIKLEKDIQKAKATLEKRRLSEARKEIEEIAAKYGMSVEDVMASKAAKKTGAKGAAKYANPDDASQTWTGRGRQPAWYRAAVEAGTDPATMLL